VAAASTPAGSFNPAGSTSTLALTASARCFVPGRFRANLFIAESASVAAGIRTKAFGLGAGDVDKRHQRDIKTGEQIERIRWIMVCGTRNQNGTVWPAIWVPSGDDGGCRPKAAILSSVDLPEPPFEPRMAVKCACVESEVRITPAAGCRSRSGY